MFVNMNYISQSHSLICIYGNRAPPPFFLGGSEHTAITYGSLFYDAFGIPLPPPFPSAASGSHFPSGLLWAPMTNFYVFIKNERAKILLCHHSLRICGRVTIEWRLGISIGVILGFDVLAFPVGY